MSISLYITCVPGVLEVKKRVSGTVGYIDGCELPCGYWTSNPGPLLQQCGGLNEKPTP